MELGTAIASLSGGQLSSCDLVTSCLYDYFLWLELPEGNFVDARPDYFVTYEVIVRHFAGD